MYKKLFAYGFVCLCSIMVVAKAFSRGKAFQSRYGENTGVSGETYSVSDIGLFAGVKFVKIKAGSFTMGEIYMGVGEEVPVDISRPFEIMATEVTQAQYVAVMGENPSFFKDSWYCKNYDSVKDMCPDLPVEHVLWNDVQVFIKKLNESKGL